MKNIKTLAQLKRELKEGATFTFVDHWRDEFKTQKRQVTVVQTNAVYTIVPDEPDNKVSKANNGKGYHMLFDKASNWKFEDGVCTYCYYFNGRPSAWYSFIVD